MSDAPDDERAAAELAWKQCQRAVRLFGRAIETAHREKIPTNLQLVALGVTISGACLTSPDPMAMYQHIGELTRQCMSDPDFQARGAALKAGTLH